MPYVVRHVQLMDLTLFAVHSAHIAGRQRGVNIGTWLVPYLGYQGRVDLSVRYRHVDTGKIAVERHPFGRRQKNRSVPESVGRQDWCG